MEGIAKTSRGVRTAPRSKPTTFSPALVSSRERMLPVQPMPMTTASTSLSLVTIVSPLSREVRDRLRGLVVFLVEVGLDLLAITRGQAWEADHLPRHLVLVAAIDRVGKEALHGDLIKLVEEHRARESLKFGLARFERFHRLFALRLGQAIEILAVGLIGPGVGCRNPRTEEFPRRQRQLIAELRL